MDTRAQVCVARFLDFFPGGFADETYQEWERNYKVAAHERFNEALGKSTLARLLAEERYEDVAARAIRAESSTNLLFTFEKMALRDAVRTRESARAFATALDDWLYGAGALKPRFERWVAAVDALPRRQTRVLTWPLVSVFGFLVHPSRHLFIKPKAMRAAAAAWGCGTIDYASRPDADGYARWLAFARAVKREIAPLGARDMIDVQSFLWVIGSDEYEHMRRWRRRPAPVDLHAGA